MNVKSLESILVLHSEFSHLELSKYKFAEALLTLKKLNNTIGKYNNIACERELTDSECKAQTRAENKAISICKDVLMCECIIQHDPRGNAIGLLLPSKRYNSFDGETWRIDY